MIILKKLSFLKNHINSAIKQSATALLVISSTIALAEFDVQGVKYSNQNQTGSNYLYTQVTVKNNSAKSQGYRLEFEGNRYKANTKFIVDAPQLDIGDTRIHNIPIADNESYYLSLSLIPAIDGKTVNSSLTNNNDVMFLRIADNASQLNNLELQTLNSELTTATSRIHPGYGGSYGGSSQDLLVQLTDESIPINWLCYTPFESVSISEQLYGRISQDAKSALNQYVDLGGTLIVFGSESEKSENVGMGKIEYTSKENASNAKYIAGLKAKYSTQDLALWRQQNGNSCIFDSLSKTPGTIGAALLIIIFTIIVGPLNYLYYYKKKDIRKLLISTPIISTVFCFLIVCYFFATRGFTRQGGTISITYLNNKTNTADSLQFHSFNSGLYPVGGFTFDSQAFLKMPWTNENNVSMNLTNSQHLTNGIYSPSTTMAYNTLSRSTTREKIIYNGNEHTVVNGFESDIDKILILDKGSFYFADNIAKSGQAKLTPIDNSQVETAKSQLSSNDTSATSTLFALASSYYNVENRSIIESMVKVMSSMLNKDTDGPIYLALFNEPTSWSIPGVKIDSPILQNVLFGNISAEGKE